MVAKHVDLIQQFESNIQLHQHEKDAFLILNR